MLVLERLAEQHSGVQDLQVPFTRLVKYVLAHSVQKPKNMKALNKKRSFGDLGVHLRRILIYHNGLGCENVPWTKVAL